MLIEKYGNMSAASIPVALDEAYSRGSIQKDDNIVMVAFGVAYPGLPYWSMDQVRGKL